ncbi:glycoside hydrolase family 43 protein [Lewinella sp. JB7]|uniref:glycoside hydrolase family 43 protein n=1 Tax=Lewinella sp. JB7 TaxID=2962887 RepID=UPI0020C96DF7|nr:glycoside hydrolase family 43 protein [Lewinella sp. JB7]MCP9236210.1 glycoside hydrolase family 43 protein [Lewinella sp. JB7]
MKEGLLFSLGLLLLCPMVQGQDVVPPTFNNPIIQDKYTADPAALVYNDMVFLYTGHDEAPLDFHFYKMNEWLVFSSTDMVHWEEYPVPLRVSDFSWAKADAWAAQTTERDGKFYFYVTVEHATVPGKAIGVAVADRPTGPFRDALGKALVTNDMTTATDISWDDIDPTVFTDDDGQAYLFWGNTVCYYAPLKDNMIELAGEIKVVEGLPHFTEAPWIHRRGDWYYLSYAQHFPEKTAYAMSRSIHGPWQYGGILNELAGNSNTNHQSIIEYRGVPYFIYHTGGISPHGGSFRRSVSIDRLHYNPDGTLQRVIMTSEGIQKQP